MDALCLLFLEKTDATQSCEDGSLDFTTVLRKALAMSRQVPWQKVCILVFDQKRASRVLNDGVTTGHGHECGLELR